MLDSTQFESLVDDQPRAIPMDADGVYSLGAVEGGLRFVPDRAVGILLDVPNVSTGLFSVGTNDPDYDNVLAPIPWNLLTSGVHEARDYPLLAGGHTSKSIAPETELFVKVQRGLLDEGGLARLVLLGFSYPAE